MCLIGVRQNFTHRPHRTYFTQLSWLSHLRSLNNLNTWSHWLLAKFPASISSWGPFSFSFSASPRSWKSAANQHIANIWYWGKVHPLHPYRPRRIPLNNHPLRGMSWFHLVGACLRLDFWRLSWLLKWNKGNCTIHRWKIWSSNCLASQCSHLTSALCSQTQSSSPFQSFSSKVPPFDRSTSPMLKLVQHVANSSVSESNQALLPIQVLPKHGCGGAFIQMLSNVVKMLTLWASSENLRMTWDQTPPLLPCLALAACLPDEHADGGFKNRGSVGRMEIQVRHFILWQGFRFSVQVEANFTGIILSNLARKS